jgi:hypothetical protein
MTVKPREAVGGAWEYAIPLALLVMTVSFCRTNHPLFSLLTDTLKLYTQSGTKG